MQVVQEIKPDDKPITILQQLCDQYVLERDELVYHVAYPAAFMHCLLPGISSNPECSHTFSQCLEQDDILGVLRLTLRAMHNIPLFVNCRIRDDEGYPHSALHMLLWMCHPTGVRFDSEALSQGGRLDVGIVTPRYRHYLELKREGASESAKQAHQQIQTKSYNQNFPREALDQAKPAFYYGVKWTNKSTHATVYIGADEQAQQTVLWKEKLATLAGEEKIIHVHDL